MKKIFYLLLSLLPLAQVFCQIETFDIATYTPPKDWKKDTKDGAVIYSNTNTNSGSFCVLAIYTSTVSTGNAQKDFDKDWNDLAVAMYKAAANPKTETETSPEGWKAVAALAKVKQGGVESYVLLTVFSGFGKSMSMLANFNDPSYATNIDALMGDMKLDTTSTTVAANNINNVQTIGGTQQFGSVLYTPPLNWKVEKYPDGDILIPADLPKDQFLEIWVMPSMNFSGTMEQALQKSYDETIVKLKATKMNDVNGGNYNMITTKKSFRGWEYIRCSAGIHLGGGEYPPEFGLDLFLVKLNDRFEQVAILKKRGSCDYSSYYPTDKLNYYNDVDNFLFSLQFTDWKEPVAKPGTIEGSGITGVWQGIGLSVGMAKPGTELGAELKVKQAIFFNNGQVYFGTKFPTEGLDGLNTWVRAEQNRRDWGTYTFTGDKGVIKLFYGEIPMRMENNKLILTTNKTDHGFIKMKTVDGAIFNGTYTLSSKNFLGEETGKTPMINFTAGGKFTDNGAISIMYHPTVTCLNEAKDPGMGTYEVKNHSVIFNYTDGRKIKIAFIGSDYDKNNQIPATLTLSFNEDIMTKK